MGIIVEWFLWFLIVSKTVLVILMNYSFKEVWYIQYGVALTFYKPATIIEIDEFQQNSGFILLSDLQDLFLIHNGARLFINPEVFDDPSWYIFSLEEIVSALNDYSLPNNQYPIAKYDDVLICTDNDSL